MLRAAIDAGSRRQGTARAAGGARSPWCAALLAAAGVACSGERPPPPERPAAAPMPASMQEVNGGSCVDDGYYISRFCDRGFCAEPVKNWSYGSRCDPDTKEVGVLGDCGAYICIDGRCRSCQTDAECKDPSRWGETATSRRSSGRQIDAEGLSPSSCVDYRYRGHGKRCGLIEPDRGPRPPVTPPPPVSW
jgi:hypothetical protein